MKGRVDPKKGKNEYSWHKPQLYGRQSLMKRNETKLKANKRQARAKGMQKIIKDIQGWGDTD